MRDINKVEIPRFVWKPQKKFNDNRVIYGFDTETVNGYARLITVSDGSYDFVKSFKECAEFLFQYRYESGLNFFFNLRYDYTAILKHLPTETIKLLLKNGQVNYGEYRIKYIPKKYFQIKKGRHVVSFYDIAQFYHMSLKEAAKYVNLEKGDYEVTEMTEEKLQDKLLLKYALQDAYITGKLGEYFRNMVTKLTTVRHYFSCASIAKRYVLTKGIRINFPYNPFLLDMALKSYQGGRFEVLQRGNFENLYTYDINSAYPFEIANLQSCQGLIKRNNEYEPDAIHSFFKCSVDIYNVMLSPLKWQMDSGLMVYPAGEFNDVYLTKSEYELIYELGFPIKILSAVHIFNKEPNKPFEYFKDLYNERIKLKEKNDDLELAYKYIMNSFYGCLIQAKKQIKQVDYITGNFEVKDGEMTFYDGKYKTGSLFNPIWASEVTANVRVKLFKDFERKANYMVSIATDGVMLTKSHNVKISPKLGEYDYERDSGLVLGSGIYHTKNKCRFRGFGRKLDLFQVLKDNQEKTLIPFKKTRPMNLKESLIQKDLGHEKINLFLEERKVLDLNFDNKRLWERNFQNAKDCLENRIVSAPIRQ